MSEIAPTMGELEDEITRNLGRKRESEIKGGEEVLIELFEGRMNRALDQYSDMLKFMGQATLIGASSGN